MLRVMRKTGTKTADKLEEDLSEEAAAKLASAVRLLLTSLTAVLLPLEGIEKFAWFSRVWRILRDKDGEGRT